MPRRKQQKNQDNHITIADVFYSDLSSDDMLYAALIRSPAARATISSITVPVLPDGYIFISAADIPGKNELLVNDNIIPIFADTKTHYVGEPIGILAGPDERTVHELVSSIEIQFDESTVFAALEIAHDTFVPQLEPDTETQVANENEIAQIAAAMNFTMEMPAHDDESSNTEIDIEKNLADDTSESRTTENDIPENIETLDNSKIPGKRIVAERIIRTGIFSEKIKSNEIENKIESDEINSEKIQSNEIKDETDIKKETTSEEKKSDIENIFEDADYNIFTETNKKETWQNFLEASGAYVTITDDNITVYTRTQTPNSIRASIANVLGISSEHIFVKQTKTTEKNHNGTWRTTVLAIQAAIVAHFTKKNVRLVLSRDEQAHFMSAGVSAIISHQSAVTKDGIIKAIKIDIDIDVGAYNPFTKIILDRAVISSCSVYNFESALITARAFATSEPPTSLHVRTIDSQSFFAMENHIAKIIQKTNLLPNEVRMRNFAKGKNSLPFSVIEKNGEKIFEQLDLQSTFKRKYCAYKFEMYLRQNFPNKYPAIARRGIGMAVAYDGANYMHPFFWEANQKMEIKLALEENAENKSDVMTATVISHIPLKEIKTQWISTIEKTFGIQKSKIKFEDPVAENTLLQEKKGASLSVIMDLFEKCVKDLQKKNNTQKKLPLSSMKTVPTQTKKSWIDETLTGTPFYDIAFAAAAIELQSEQYTNAIQIKNIWLIIDCGRVVSVPAAEKTIKLAIQHELSNVIEDQTVPCSNISVSFLQSSSPPCPIGSIIHNIIPPAFAGALGQALGKDINDIPCPISVANEYNSRYNDIITANNEKETDNATDAVVETVATVQMAADSTEDVGAEQ